MSVMIFFCILGRSHIKISAESIGEKAVIVPTAEQRNFPDGVFAECQKFACPPQPDPHDHLPDGYSENITEKLGQVGQADSGGGRDIRYGEIGPGVIDIDVVSRQFGGTTVIAGLGVIPPEVPESQNEQRDQRTEHFAQQFSGQIVIQSFPDHFYLPDDEFAGR